MRRQFGRVLVVHVRLGRYQPFLAAPPPAPFEVLSYSGPAPRQREDYNLDVLHAGYTAVELHLPLETEVTVYKLS